LKKFLVGLLAVFAMTVPAGEASASTSVSAHSCSSSYTHAVLSYGHRCLRRGQFCSMGEQSNYRRYGYRCVSGRLR
jgi:hypothetical protein